MDGNGKSDIVREQERESLDDKAVASKNQMYP